MQGGSWSPPGRGRMSGAYRVGGSEVAVVTDLLGCAASQGQGSPAVGVQGACLVPSGTSVAGVGSPGWGMLVGRGIEAKC